MKKIALIAISLAIFACSDSGSNNNEEEELPSSSSDTNQDNPSSGGGEENPDPIKIEGPTNAAAIKASGDTLFVVLQRLEWGEESSAATKPGLLVIKKASTGATLDTIQLKFRNPNSAIINNGTLIISSAKHWSSENDNSGVEIVDLKTGKSEILADKDALGGNGANAIALDKANQILYVSVNVDWGNSPVKSINLSTKSVGAALPNITDSQAGLVFENGKLFVADREYGNEKLKVYENGTTTAVSGDALPPYSLAVSNSLLLDFTSDYTTGVLRYMDKTSTTLTNKSIDFGQDSKVFANGENIFVLSRSPDILSCVKEGGIADEDFIEKSLPNNSNPYEVAVVGNNGYIVLYGLNYIQVFDVNTCALKSTMNISE